MQRKENCKEKNGRKMKNKFKVNKLFYMLLVTHFSNF